MTEAEIKFAQDQIALAKYLQSLKPQEQIAELCSIHQCSEKRRKVHKAQFLEKRWNPHPLERFVRWWMNRGWEDTEAFTDRAWSTYDPKDKNHKPINVVKAYNCEAVRECYRYFLQEQRTEMDHHAAA